MVVSYIDIPGFVFAVEQRRPRIVVEDILSSLNTFFDLNVFCSSLIFWEVWGGDYYETALIRGHEGFFQRVKPRALFSLKTHCCPAGLPQRYPLAASTRWMRTQGATSDVLRAPVVATGTRAKRDPMKSICKLIPLLGYSTQQ